MFSGQPENKHEFIQPVAYILYHLRHMNPELLSSLFPERRLTVNGAMGVTLLCYFWKEQGK